MRLVELKGFEPLVRGALDEGTWRTSWNETSLLGHSQSMFLFFSNRLGCAGSLLLSAAATGVLFLVLTR